MLMMISSAACNIHYYSLLLIHEFPLLLLLLLLITYFSGPFSECVLSLPQHSLKFARYVRDCGFTIDFLGASPQGRLHHC